MSNLSIKRENDRMFREGSFPEMLSLFHPKPPEVPEVQRSPFSVREHLVKCDTITAVLMHPGKRCMALNFANANCPGGAYILGGNAQEEALCRASLLFYTIRTSTDYYLRNQLHVLPNYTDGMILSRHVPVIRDASGALLDTPMEADFITSPAVNRYFARLIMSRRKLDETMERRIAGIIRLAAKEHPEVLILGAYGCGQFGNKRADVYPMFERAITHYLPEDIEVVFADPHPAP